MYQRLQRFECRPCAGVGMLANSKRILLYTCLLTSDEFKSHALKQKTELVLRNPVSLPSFLKYRKF